MGHQTLVSPGYEAADELTRWGCVTRVLCNPLYSLSFYLLYPLFSFLALEAYVLSKFFDTQVPRFPLRNLCSLAMLAVPSLFLVAMDTAYR